MTAGSDPLVDEHVHVLAGHVEDGPGERQSAHHLEKFILINYGKELLFYP